MSSKIINAGVPDVCLKFKSGNPAKQHYKQSLFNKFNKQLLGQENSKNSMNS